MTASVGQGHTTDLVRRKSSSQPASDLPILPCISTLRVALVVSWQPKARSGQYKDIGPTSIAVPATCWRVQHVSQTNTACYADLR